VTGEWREQDEELHDLCSSPSIIRIIKARRMRWAGHIARMGIRGRSVGCWWESQKESGLWEGQDVGGWIISGRIL
jgi:hypothetical protein